MTIETIAVVGAGLLGRGIAQLSARGGYRTILEDISGQMLDEAMADVRAGLDEAARSRVRAEKVIEDAVRDADLVIEAAPEDPETTFEIFTILDRACPPRTIFASSGSSMNLAEIASVTLRADRFLGMRFLLMKRLEIVPETREEVLAAAEEVGRRRGKETVRVQESYAGG